MMQITETVKQLIIINIIFFVGSLIVGPAADDILALHYPANTDFKVWQPITYMFMHSQVNFRHILFNMLGLFMFGTTLEQLWGARKFLFFYISCGVGAALLHLLINYLTISYGVGILDEAGFAKSTVLSLLHEGKYNPAWEEILTPSQFSGVIQAYVTPMLGASGALYGIFAAYAFLFPDREMGMLFLPITIKVKYFVGVMILSDLYLGFKGTPIFGSGGDGIAHFAHLGGALIGYIMMWYWNKNQFDNKRWN